jgi:CheY-like chemotaxis protein
MMNVVMRSEPNAALSGQTILVVDDQAPVRSLIRQTLEPQGAVIVEAVSAAEALAILKRHKGALALALVDFVMPGISGLDLAVELAREAPGLKILYMSSATESIAMESLLRRSPERVLLKPFTLEELIARVVFLLRGG